MQQLRFPQDYVVPPAVINLAELKVGPDHGLNHIYVVTLVQKYPQRYNNVKAWADTAPANTVTLWPGRLYEEMTWEERAQINFPNQELNTYDKQVTSITFNHISIWRDALAKGYQRILVLEDDVVFSHDFVERLNGLVGRLVGPFVDRPNPVDGDIVYLGDGIVGMPWHFHAGPDESQVAEGLFWRRQGDSRCADSYIIKAATIAKGLNMPVNTAIDHFLNIIGKEVTVLWAEPTFVTQGSMRSVANFELR